MNEEKVLYKITAYDSDYIKEQPDKARTLGGTFYYCYDFKNHRYLSQFISDDFNIYEELQNLQCRIIELQNNWNELKKYISAEWYCFDNESVEFEIAKDILNKMQEMEQGKDEDNTTI